MKGSGRKKLPRMRAEDKRDAGETGMSLRDWFAGMALAGMAVSGRTPDPRTHSDTVTLAYKLADAMLKVRGDGSN